MNEEARMTKATRMRAKMARFFKEVKSELKRVIWPTRKQLVNNTATVLMGCLIIGIFIWLADLAFGQISALVFTR